MCFCYRIKYLKGKQSIARIAFEYQNKDDDMVKQQQKHSLWPFIVAEHFSLPISEPGKNSYDGPCM